MGFSTSQKQAVLEFVDQIPTGKITTYGFIGQLTNINPRVVGWIMSGLSEQEQLIHPWQRVVAKGGHISTLKLGPRGIIQIEMLKKEGLVFVDDKIKDYQSYFWTFGSDIPFNF